MKNTLQLKTINSATGVLKCEHFDIELKLKKSVDGTDWMAYVVKEDDVLKNIGIRRAYKHETWEQVADMFGANVVLGK